MRVKLLICLLFVVTACVGNSRIRNIETRSTFDPLEAAFINEQGTGSIAGQAFLNQHGGQVAYAADNDVILIPSTAYARERFQIIYGSSKLLNIYGAVLTDGKTGTDPKYKEMQRTVRADGEGRFKFDRLAPGNYFIQAGAFWKVGDSAQGGYFYETVSLADGEQKDIIMNGR